MKVLKKIGIITFLLSLGVNLSAQTTLPTYYSFDAPAPPTGWTLFLDVVVGANTYANGSDGTPSCRLDGTGEYVMIHFVDEPDTVDYFIRGTGVGTAVSPGTIFTVEESANGANWTPLRILDENNLTGSFQKFVDFPSSSTRYVRFFYTQKVSGSNIALDEVRITKAQPGPAAKIEIYQGANRILNGETVYIPNLPSLNLEIFNQGTVNTLFLTGNSIAGPQAAEFSISSLPGSISAQSSYVATVNFNPAGNGSRKATLTIQNSDVGDNPFVIQLYGVSGPLATEPLQQPSSMSFSNLTTYSLNLHFQHPNNQPEKYLILRKTNPITEVPVDGETYQRGDYIGNAQVAYIGSNTSYIANNIRAAKGYHFRIFSFNGPSGYENYLTTNPLSGIANTPNNMIGSYYQGFQNSTNLLNDLHLKIRNHTQVPYVNYINTIIDNFENYDTTANRLVINCAYSNYKYVYTNPFQWDTMSREHVFPHSWYPTNPATQLIEYSDLYNLFPTHLNRANIPRHNHPFGEVVTVTQSFLDGKLGLDINGNTVYEPADEMKGNVARAIFYMLTRYHTVNGNNWFLPVQQSQQLLKDWHFNDPPDGYEIARNDYINSRQGNRNPFIDSIHFVCYIDFTNMTYISTPPGWCVSLSSSENNFAKPKIYPNPADDYVQISLPHTNQYFFRIIDLTGKQVFSGQFYGSDCRVETSAISPGYYLLHIQSNDKQWMEKIAVK
ncbi:MAG: endonuclease [Flavobacteriales bacterium]